MTARREQDRGLGAVERVREVRDRDSQLGLRHASEEHRARLVEAERLEEAMRTHAAASTSHDVGMAEFAAQRRVLVALAASARGAHEAVASAARLKAAAHDHWLLDRTRLRAVQHLLEVRDEAWQAELARTTARELDDIGGQLWLRNREEAS
jgi:flagellar export protein FliJ